MLRTILKLAYDKQKCFTRAYVRRARNPGVERRMALLNDDQLETTVEELEQMDEANFSELHKSHKEYEKEAQQYRERLQSWIVGNKYFKTKQLNFLTWSEKEQIRYLHNFDPEEWTIDKLVGSFPADRYSVAKIVKAKWIPRDGNRIQRHDEAVRENWEMFKSGRIRNIDEGFAEHLNKFVHRNFKEVQQPKVETKRLYEIQNIPDDGEFTQIITSCKKYAKSETVPPDIPKLESGQNSLENVPNVKFKAPNQDMFMTGEVEDRRPKTFRQMGGKFANQNENASSNMESQSAVLKIDKREKDLINFDNEKPVADIKEHITIPRKLYKKGATYQLDDCFYDDDGEFLYRVPGMNGATRN
ncbi:uncharacterized protein LOC129760683 [Uranotaenia lowii]|uniref:uncharacterized protein LOC129760683 n=1 Tax=Uranotaenia lowii TaxID=190385 RepID=UPI00247A4133|nr:uncharacterized protein LOC129760683 [Uranotaenia lowii]